MAELTDLQKAVLEEQEEALRKAQIEGTPGHYGGENKGGLTPQQVYEAAKQPGYEYTQGGFKAKENPDDMRTFLAE